MDRIKIQVAVHLSTDEWLADKLVQLSERLAEMVGANMDANEQVLIEAARRLRAAQ